MHDARRLEFGDFQTPPALATQVVEYLRAAGVRPRAVLEPTCGRGAFVHAARAVFADADVAAFDINPEYVQATATAVRPSGRALTCQTADFFAQNWRSVIDALADPLLVLGNPPWVTTSGLGAAGSHNQPQRSNFHRRRGLEAVTGRSNFDVAEWMLLKLIESAGTRCVVVAVLVKTSVARRVLASLWSTGAPIRSAAMLRIDAAAHFGIKADACLFHCAVGWPPSFECRIGELDAGGETGGRLGWRDGALVSDPLAYDRGRALLRPPGAAAVLRWRSGIKHDCAAVMELRRDEATGALVNGYGRVAAIEPDYVYPLLKGTDLAHGRVSGVRRWMLVTQQRPGDDTAGIAGAAPRTWAYLTEHAAAFERRRSVIHRNRPHFSVFGVGPYTFAPWKVAISALHKRLGFCVVGPIQERPVVFDDTCCQLPFDSEAGARLAVRLLDADAVRGVLESLVFWDAKRPITADLLQRLDLGRAAAALGVRDEFEQHAAVSVRWNSTVPPGGGRRALHWTQ